MASSTRSMACWFDFRLGANPPSSPTPVENPRDFRMRRSAWKTSAPARRPSRKVGEAERQHHELLDVDGGVGVSAAVQDVHHRYRHATSRRCPAGRTGRAGGGRAEVPAGGGRLGERHRHAEEGVGAEAALGRRAVERDHHRVERLAGRSPGRRTRRADVSVHVADRRRTPLPKSTASCRRRAARAPRVRPSTRPTALPPSRMHRPPG